MNINFKLFFKYIYFGTNQIFLKYLHKNEKNTIIFLTPSHSYYTFLHIKLSSLFYSTQLVDIFSYEVPVIKNELIESKISNLPNQSSSILVYNFHSILTQQRFFFFLNNSSQLFFKKKNIHAYGINSITELFTNANWLEREAAELHGVFFIGKKDIRNLMLPYGDSSAPLKKSFPSIGIKEIFYDVSSDLLIQNPVSIQF